MTKDEATCSGVALDSCQMCKGKDLFLVLDLGMHAPADAFLKQEQLVKTECRFPLRLVQCRACGLLQLDYLADKELFYGPGYVYVSSTTKHGRDHYHSAAKEIVEEFSVPQGSLVIDIGSNVGVLLQGFKDKGMKVLGVDPAVVPAGQANENGIPTLVSFFTSSVAKTIEREHGKASVITGTNVFAHLHERDDVVAGMKSLLRDDGVIVIEAPYALDTIEHLEYDQIYLEHLAYLSIRPMRAYFASHGLELFNVKKLDIHGGTLRYYVGFPKAHNLSPEVAAYEEKEEAYGLYTEATMRDFRDRVFAQRAALLELLHSLQKEGKKVVGISAPAKGNTLLTFCHIDTALLPYTAEKNPLKVGLYTPATRIPVVSDDMLRADNPDYALLLAWNFADEIMRNMQSFREKGGKFIIPVPHPRIV